MLLSQYLAITQSLIQTPGSTVPLISTALLTQYINIARGQVAGQAECVPAIGQVVTTPGITGYAFSTIGFSATDAPMIAGAINIRMINLVTATGQKRLTVREWPWFNNFIIAKPTETRGPPKVWTQYRQGSQGVFFINIPDQAYELAVDAVCYPVPLVDDTTVDAIPYLWTDAVPFYAAYYTYMAFQRQADADHFLNRFGELMGRARVAATPPVLPGSYPQGPDPMLPNRLGVHPAGPGGQQGAPAQRRAVGA
jgi:hypothetical protein